MSAPVQGCLFIARRTLRKSIPGPSSVTRREWSRQHEESRYFQKRDPEHNPQSLSFSQVTCPRCRRPLHSFFCGPDAANFGDPMRVWVLFVLMCRVRCSVVFPSCHDVSYRGGKTTRRHESNVNSFKQCSKNSRNHPKHHAVCAHVCTDVSHM